MCTPDGCPVAVEVFEGNLGDPTTLAASGQEAAYALPAEAHRACQRPRHDHQGAHRRRSCAPRRLDWITALRAPAIKALVAEGGPLQLSLFDERDMAEIVSDDYPGERFVVCRNPEFAAERARKRVELLDATETGLVKIRAMIEKKRAAQRSSSVANARQVMKRSKGPHFAVAEMSALTRNERRFYDDQRIEIIDLPLVEAAEAIVG